MDATGCSSTGETLMSAAVLQNSHCVLSLVKIQKGLSEFSAFFILTTIFHIFSGKMGVFVLAGLIWFGFGLVFLIMFGFFGSIWIIVI